MENSNEKGDKVIKLLAACGHGSRRSCEELIDMLRVTINGKVCERGDRYFPGDDVRLDNKRLKLPQMYYYKLHKPRGYLCNESPDKTANHINSLMPRTKQRLFPVGRLDKDFEGLMIYTNDGELCNRLTHPRYQCPKMYEVVVRGRVPDTVISKISKGVFLSEGKTAPIEMKVKRQSNDRTVIHMEIRENRRRLIPRVFANQEFHVDRVKRISVGPIKMKGLAIGKFEKLTFDEVKQLKGAAFKKEGKTLQKKKHSRFNPNDVKLKRKRATKKKTSTKKTSKKKQRNKRKK